MYIVAQALARAVSNRVVGTSENKPNNFNFHQDLVLLKNKFGASTPFNSI